MKFGIELEIIGLTRQQAARVLQNANIPCQDSGYNHNTIQTWKVVHDSSISSRSGGCEVVSPPMILNAESLQQLKTVCEALNDAGADVNKSCGVHVHIDVNEESSETIANVFNRYKKFETTIDTFMPVSRRSNNGRYCQSLIPQSDRIFRDKAQIRSMCSVTRYLKVNLQSFARYGTIEFRQHSGSINASKLIKWISFLSEFVAASRVTTTTIPTSIPTPTVRVSAKRQSILNLIRNNPTSAEDIASCVGSTAASVQSMICHLRSAGFNIERQSQKYVLRTVQASTESRVVSNSASDSLWTGINPSIRAYYETRAQVLA